LFLRLVLSAGSILVWKLTLRTPPPTEFSLHGGVQARNFECPVMRLLLAGWRQDDQQVSPPTIALSTVGQVRPCCSSSNGPRVTVGASAYGLLEDVHKNCHGGRISQPTARQVAVQQGFPGALDGSAIHSEPNDLISHYRLCSRCLAVSRLFSLTLYPNIA
jgi:hypothetical protein